MNNTLVRVYALTLLTLSVIIMFAKLSNKEIAEIRNVQTLNESLDALKKAGFTEKHPEYQQIQTGHQKIDRAFCKLGERTKNRPFNDTRKS